MKRLRIKQFAKYGVPQNKREDLVWNRGFSDGSEAVKQNFKKIVWKFYWKVF